MNSAPRREDTPPHIGALASRRRVSQERPGTGPAVLPFAAAGARLTAAEIDERVDRLARDLTARGARPGTAVAVVLPRSPALVLALVAVMRTGAAHLALDPEHPDRMARALAHTPPVCAVCAPETADRTASLLTAGHAGRNTSAHSRVRPVSGP
ncbi:hypothetical protein GCM10009799_13620 [Nocardiopsis rhodophaea]|uniref:AMP-dependent synthetase/ligase domain-containing protein n=1 Tax=Nocardiopsis rhodophaea TaxID=280238 RepID=A0ABN2SM76_9ACTN